MQEAVNYPKSTGFLETVDNTTKTKKRNHRIGKICSQNPIFYDKGMKQYAMGAFKEFETKCWDEEKSGGRERERERRGGVG